MKTFILIITFAIGLAFDCAAQLTINPVISGGTNQVATGTTNAYSLPSIVNTRANKLSIQCTGRLTVNTNSTVLFQFDASNDNANWHSNYTSVTLTCSTTNLTSVISNLDLTGIPFLRLSTIANTNLAGTFTNITVYTVSKTGTSGN